MDNSLLSCLRTDPPTLVCELDGDLGTYSQQTAEALALMPFVGKLQPTGQKTANIGWGLSGSGKTSSMLWQAQDPNAVYIAADEGGAIYDIPGYAIALDGLLAERRAIKKEGIANDPRLIGNDAQREALYNQHVALSNRVRALTFNEAVFRGFNIVFDSGSGHPSVSGTDKKLKERGYHVKHTGVMASLEVAEPRTLARDKVMDWRHVFSKRPNAYKNLPELVSVADSFDLYLNDVNGQTPFIAMKFEKGKLVEAHPDAVRLMTDILDRDVYYYHHRDEFFKGDTVKNDYAKSIAPEMEEARAKLLNWLQEIEKAAAPGKQPPVLGPHTAQHKPGDRPSNITR